MALFALAIVSCEKEAKVKLPKTESLPVISCFISPEDTLLQLKLTRSQPLYENAGIDPNQPVPDAEVHLSGPGGTKTMSFNPSTGYYELSPSVFAVQYGSSYRVDVKTGDSKSAYAETTVPLRSVAITTVTTQEVQEPYGQSTMVKVVFQDDPVAENWYRLSFAIVSIWEGDTTLKDYGYSFLYSDSKANGGDFEIKEKLYYYVLDSISNYLELALITASRPYFMFHKSCQNYVGEDPFSEPSLIYTNVEGGFGVFAAYARSRFR